MKTEFRNSIIVLIFLFFAIIGNAQSDNIKIIRYSESVQSYLKVHDFYLTHHLYIDLFLRENLYADAKAEDVAYILNEIKKGVSLDVPLDIEVDLGENVIYKIRIKIAKKDDQVIFIAFTNFNPNTRTYEKDFGGDSYTRWYFLSDDKMTYRKDISGENDYSKLNEIELANAYLFDEIADNDEKVESNILKAKDIDANKNVESELRIGLISLKNSVFNNDEKKVLELSEQMNKQLELNKQNYKRIESVFRATEFQVEIMKLLSAS